MRLAATALSVWLVAGCGPAGEGRDVSAEPKPVGGGTPARGATELTVEVSTAPGKEKRVYTLRCDPPGGNHPDAETACRALRRMDAPFAPLPPDSMCTEIFGGPQTATVTGTLRGRPVQADFSRTDGCQIERWDAHAAVLVEPGGPGDD